MARSKRFPFGESEQRLADFARGLAHPARVIMLRRLVGEGPQGYNSLVRGIELSPGTLNVHLHQLEKAAYLIAPVNLFTRLEIGVLIFMAVLVRVIILCISQLDPDV